MNSYSEKFEKMRIAGKLAAQVENNSYNTDIGQPGS